MKIRALVSALILVSGFAAASVQANDISAQLDPKTPCNKPEYPRSSLVNEETGTVSLSFVISENGNVVESKVVKSSGFKNLDRAAESAFSKCKFKPVVKNGTAVQAPRQFDFVWTLG
jgi:protein TonB